MRVRLVLASVLLAAGFAAAPAASSAWAQTGHGAGHGPAVGGAPAMSAASQSYMDAMRKMDRDMAAMPMSGAPGVDFATMMIPHHQAAIDMAKAYLASGENDPDIAKLSREIIEAQEREIAFLKRWLAARPKR